MYENGAVCHKGDIYQDPGAGGVEVFWANFTKYIFLSTLCFS